MIRVECDDCSRSYRVKPQLAGKRVRCKGCGGVFTVPRPRRAKKQSTQRRTTARQRPQRRRSSPRDEFGDVDDYDDFAFDDFAPDDEFDDIARSLPPARRRPSGSKGKKRKRRRSGSENKTLFLILGLAGGGLLLVAAILGFFVPPMAAVVAGGIMLTGALAVIGGGLWCLIKAFEEDAMCGFMYLFVPFYSLYYIISRFAETQRGVFAWGAGVLLLLFGFIYMNLVGAAG